MLEWLAYHHMIGVTRFLIYHNDCTDGTVSLLEAASDALPITHLPNPAVGRAYQMEALRHASTHPAVTRADWLWISDVDEFLVVHVGNHAIADLVAACGDPAAISVTFRFFANGGVNRFRDRPVIRQFHRCNLPEFWATDSAIEVKTLVQSDFPLHHLGAHRPFVKGRATPKWTDGSGRPVPSAFLNAANNRRLRRFPSAGAQRFATLNHYALRSMESFLIKRDRGDVNRPNRAFDVDYWRDRNDVACEDQRIMRHWPALRDALRVLRSDARIDAAHRACVAHHETRAAEIRASKDGSALWQTLKKAPTVSSAEQTLCDELGIAPG